MVMSLSSLALAVATIIYSLLSDVLALPTRHLVFLHWCVGSPLPSLALLGRGGLLAGVLGAGAALLLCIGCAALFPHRRVSTLVEGSAVMFLVDAAFQMPALLFAEGGASEAPRWRLPADQALRTGFVTLFLQIPVAADLAVGGLSRRYPSLRKAMMSRRAMTFAGAVALRKMSFLLAESTVAESAALYTSACVCVVFAVTPTPTWRLSCRVLRRCCFLAVGAFMLLRCVSARVWTSVRLLVVSVLQHPLCLRFYENVIHPAWLALSPWFFPLANSSIAVACALSSSADLLPHLEADALQVALLHAGVLYFGSTAALGAVVLAVHAFGRTFRRGELDPLAWRRSAAPISLAARALSIPWRRFARLRHMAVFLSIHGKSLLDWYCSKFARKNPRSAVSIVVVLFTVLLKLLSDISAYLASVLAGPPAMHGDAAGAWLMLMRARSMSLSFDVADALIVVFLIAVSQAVAYSLVNRTIREADNVRRGRAHAAVALDDLNDIALIMADPRQCARCGFGPVDSHGCDDLRRHHGERAGQSGTGNGARVSNSCPSCGWFAARLSTWPRWNPMLHTAGGEAVFRQQAWNDVVIVVRAASKALVFPLALLCIGQRLSLSVSSSALLAFAYLVPWTLENGVRAWEFRRPQITRRRNEAVTQTERRPRRAGNGDPSDCGAARRQEQEVLPPITESQALANILAARPERIFLAPGGSCSVCLDAFPEGAHAAATGPASAVNLRKLSPPVVALRCGHPLHLECAEAAVGAAAASGGGRHVRCPLCREPATLAGAASARLFS